MPPLQQRDAPGSSPFVSFLQPRSLPSPLPAAGLCWASPLYSLGLDQCKHLGPGWCPAPACRQGCLPLQPSAPGKPMPPLLLFARFWVPGGAFRFSSLKKRGQCHFPCSLLGGAMEVPADAPKLPRILPSPSARAPRCSPGDPSCSPLPAPCPPHLYSFCVSFYSCLSKHGIFLLSDLNLCFFRLNSLFLPIYFSPVISVLGDVCDSY